MTVGRRKGYAGGAPAPAATQRPEPPPARPPSGAQPPGSNSNLNSTDDGLEKLELLETLELRIDKEAHGGSLGFSVLPSDGQ